MADNVARASELLEMVRMQLEIDITNSFTEALTSYLNFLDKLEGKPPRFGRGVARPLESEEGDEPARHVEPFDHPLCIPVVLPGDLKIVAHV